MPPYLTFSMAKVKIKLLLYFFPNSHDCLNNKTELISKCCHPNKFMFMILKTENDVIFTETIIL